MDENYYRELIDKVNLNEKRMWRRNEAPNVGFDDFAKLWDIINDNEATVSPQTYFEAIDLCLTSFFGTIQDPAPIWRHVLKRYKHAIENNEDKENFKEALDLFLEQNRTQIPEMTIFYNMIHIAIEDEDLTTVLWLMGHDPICPECWDQIRNDYNNYPEWAAYFECFTDFNYDYLPDSPIFRNTIDTIYSKFGDIPEYEKLRRLHKQYFSNTLNNND